MASSSKYFALVLIIAVAFPSVVLSELTPAQEKEVQNAVKNALGIKILCAACKTGTTWVGTESMYLGSRLITVTEFLTKVCLTLSLERQEQCRKQCRRLGESPGYGLETYGNFLLVSCKAVPFCTSSKLADKNRKDNIGFADRICKICKGFAGQYFTAADVVVDDDNLQIFFRPFCVAMSLFQDVDECIETAIKRFKHTYSSGKATVTPDIVCTLVGACVLTPPPETFNHHQKHALRKAIAT